MIILVKVNDLLEKFKVNFKNGKFILNYNNIIVNIDYNEFPEVYNKDDDLYIKVEDEEELKIKLKTIVDFINEVKSKAEIVEKSYERTLDYLI